MVTLTGTHGRLTSPGTIVVCEEERVVLHINNISVRSLAHVLRQVFFLLKRGRDNTVGHDVPPYDGLLTGHDIGQKRGSIS